MDFQLILSNALSPPILFFFLGVLAVAVRSDLDIPQPLPKFFSLYLLIAIGFKGGIELRHSGLSWDVVTALSAGIALSIVVPLLAFFLLRLKLDIHNSAAIAATYGSISAVTFITATSFLSSLQIPYSGHMVAAMALMESPAIIIGVLLVRLLAPPANTPTPNHHLPWSELLRDSLFNQSVVLLIGAMIIGILSGPKGETDIFPFFGTIFKGMLCLFLLDLGIVAARRAADLKKAGTFLLAFALVVPFLAAIAAILLARALSMSTGDTLLLAILAGSASYIAVPAAMRLAIPQANPGLYVPMALAITFPFNIIVGIPLYLWLISKLP